VFDRTNDPMIGLWLASICDAAGDTEPRSHALGDVVQNGPHWEQDHQNASPELITLAKLFADSTSHGEPLGESATKQFASLPPDRLAEVDYFLGQYMVHHNQTDEGNFRLDFAAKTLPFDSFAGNLARIYLHDVGAYPPTDAQAATQTAP
jgi:hypothetical protein